MSVLFLLCLFAPHEPAVHEWRFIITVRVESIEQPVQHPGLEKSWQICSGASTKARGLQPLIGILNGEGNYSHPTGCELLLVASHFLPPGGPAHCLVYDLDRDCDVDLADFALLQLIWNERGAR